jgi:hypothetical protein
VDQEEPLDDKEASTFRERCCICSNSKCSNFSTLFSDDNPVEQQQPRRESRKRKQTEAGAAFTSQELSKKKRRQRKPRQQSEITTSTCATTTTTTSSATTASTSTTMSTTTTRHQRHRRWKHQHRRPMLTPIWLHKHCSCARTSARTRRLMQMCQFVPLLATVSSDFNDFSVEKNVESPLDRVAGIVACRRRSSFASSARHATLVVDENMTSQVSFR